MAGRLPTIHELARAAVLEPNIEDWMIILNLYFGRIVRILLGIAVVIVIYAPSARSQDNLADRLYWLEEEL